MALEWRRSGAVVREVDLPGARVWYAEFQPAIAGRSLELRPFLRLPWRRRTEGARRPPPTLVLLHGLGASAATFHPVIGRLRESYRVVIPDLPGFGGSRARGGGPPTFGGLVDTAEAFVAEVAPAGAYLAGNSMGGWIAAKVAARRPDLVRGVALLNPGGPALRAEDWTDLGRMLAGEDAEASAQLVDRIFHRPPFGVRLVARAIRRAIRGPSVLQLMGSLREEDFLSEEEAARVECPAVLIWGESDRFIPAGCRSFFLERLPRVRYEPVPDCGHCPQIECPRKTAEILLRLPRIRPRKPAKAAKAARPTKAAPAAKIATSRDIASAPRRVPSGKPAAPAGGAREAGGG